MIAFIARQTPAGAKRKKQALQLAAQLLKKRLDHPLSEKDRKELKRIADEYPVEYKQLKKSLQPAEDKPATKEPGKKPEAPKAKAKPEAEMKKEDEEELNGILDIRDEKGGIALTEDQRKRLDQLEADHPTALAVLYV